MPLRKRKPTSAGRRFQTVSDFSEVTKTRSTSRNTSSSLRSIRRAGIELEGRSSMQ